MKSQKKRSNSTTRSATKQGKTGGAHYKSQSKKSSESSASMHRSGSHSGSDRA